MQRPTGVTVLAALYIFTAGILGLTSVVLIFGRTLLEGIKGPADVGPPPTAAELAQIGFVSLGVAVVNIICGIGFIKLKKWSRVLTIAFHIAWTVFWALSLVGLRLHPDLFSMVFRLAGLGIQVWILVYLFSSTVKQAFAGTAAS
jgi:hypothetical protein